MEDPYPILIAALARLKPAPKTAVGVPRRFGIGILLILVTMFAVLFAVLNLLHVNPRVFAVITVLFMGVAAGQVLLFHGKAPRDASIWVGVVLFPLELLAVGFYDWFAGSGSETFSPGGLFVTVFLGMLFGALFGYAAGVLTAAIFLVVGRGRGSIDQDDEQSAPTLLLRPFAADDIDTLEAWAELGILAGLWGAASLEPLSRARLECCLRQASGETPELLLFVGLCGTTHRMVGYAELAEIDRRAGSARLRCPLVSPREPRRGEWSIALLNSLLETAFEQLRLRRIDVVVSQYDTDAVACYRSLGFIPAPRREIAIESIYEPAWIMSLDRR